MYSMYIRLPSPVEKEDLGRGSLELIAVEERKRRKKPGGGASECPKEVRRGTGHPLGRKGLSCRISSALFGPRVSSYVYLIKYVCTVLTFESKYTVPRVVHMYLSKYRAPVETPIASVTAQRRCVIHNRTFRTRLRFNGDTKITRGDFLPSFFIFNLSSPALTQKEEKNVEPDYDSALTHQPHVRREGSRQRLPRNCKDHSKCLVTSLVFLFVVFFIVRDGAGP